MPENRILVTIDGPAGSGKTTLATHLAELLDICYLDTGAMYRAIAHRMGEKAWTRNEEELRGELAGFFFDLRPREEGCELLLNDLPLPEEIRSERVGLWASHLGKLASVREHLLQEQRRIGARVSLVVEGRDMGSVVFPWADRKFFVWADPGERAGRRFRQLRERGEEADLEALTEEMRVRDHQDSTRSLAPLQPAPDSVRIDTTDRSIQEVLEEMLEHVGMRPS